jgi:type VI protein secretion system component VasK
VLIQGANILRITALYKPLKILSAVAALFLLGGAAFGMRVLFAQPSGDIRSHALALSLAAMLITLAVFTFLIALLADIVAINRELLEDLKLRESRNRAAEARLRSVEHRRDSDERLLRLQRDK